MSYTPNNWNEIRAFYNKVTPMILSCERNEWATDAYAWAEKNMIFMTPIESWLWSDIRACDAVLYPQYPVLNYFVDFANPVAKLAIECDGAAFHDKEKDALRDRRLSDDGWTIYRISGKHCRIDDDEETGAPGLAKLFIRRICNLHGISRHTEPLSEMPLTEFAGRLDRLDAWWERLVGERNDALNRKRGLL